MVKRFPGKLNEERWAGKAITTLQDVVEGLDPTMFMTAFQLGGIFGNKVVQPMVDKARRGRDEDLHRILGF